MTIEVQVEAPAWGEALADPALLANRAVTATLLHMEAVGGVTVLLTDDASVRELNARFRGKDQPTNVLSFPSTTNPEAHLGDIALAYETSAREAAEQGTALAAHLSHLVVHGVLHLLGHDHEEDGPAEAMEALERRLLAGLGVADPYAAHSPPLHG